MNEPSRCSGTIEGVCCSVESCRYHSRGNCCTAAHIDVRDESASERSQTFCGTYRPADSWNCV